MFGPLCLTSFRRDHLTVFGRARVMNGSGGGDLQRAVFSSSRRLNSELLNFAEDCRKKVIKYSLFDIVHPNKLHLREGPHIFSVALSLASSVSAEPQP